MLKKAIIAAVAMCGAAVAFAGPAGAQDRPPCDLALTFICNIIPTAPDLDHSVDLSTQLPADPNAPDPETLPPLDPCSAGCI